MPRPSNGRKTRRLNLYFHPRTAEKIDYICDKTGFSRSDVITEAVNRWYRSVKEASDVPDHPGV